MLYLIWKLHRELVAAGVPVASITPTKGPVDIDGLCAEVSISLSVSTTPDLLALIEQVRTAHDPHDYADDVRAAAESNISHIPGWAQWTEAEALDYLDKNVTSLASAKTVLKAMARMMIALRDETYPHLQNRGRTIF